MGGGGEEAVVQSPLVWEGRFSWSEGACFRMSCIVFGGMSQTFFFPHLKKKILKFFIFFPLGGGEVKFHLGVLSFSPLLFLNKTRSWRCFLFCTTALHTKKKKKEKPGAGFFFFEAIRNGANLLMCVVFCFFLEGGELNFCNGSFSPC